jgi:hypothetical protein
LLPDWTLNKTAFPETSSEKAEVEAGTIAIAGIPIRPGNSVKGNGSSGRTINPKKGRSERFLLAPLIPTFPLREKEQIRYKPV